MKCIRCGKESSADAIACEECGFNFKDHDTYLKYMKPAEDGHVTPGKESDLIDNPVLTFVFGILSMMLPIFIFSFIAFKFSKRPAKAKLIPLRNVGTILAYSGIGVSIFVVLVVIIRFF